MRVILADDQAKVRSALRLLLEQQPGIDILGEAVDTTGLLDWAKAVCPDLVLLDWELPGLPATALLPLLQYHCPEMRVMILSSHPDDRRQALEAGADAFMSKGDPPERLLQAIEELSGTHVTGEGRP